MTDRDDKLRRLYGSLPREEPPAALDAAVLAASRRAVAPASLARKWGIPLSVAAAAVLAVGIALQMQGREDATDRSAPASASTPAERGVPAGKSTGEAPAPEAKRAAPPVPAAPPYAARRETGPNVEAPAGGAAAPPRAAAPDARSLDAGIPYGGPPATVNAAPPAAGPFSVQQAPLEIMGATSRGPVAKTVPLR